MGIFYTSDLHLGHKNILSYCNRPYSSVEEMDQTLLDNYNSIVNPDDIVYFLGDIAMGDRQAGLELIKQFNGYRILIPGNHDYNHSMHKESIRDKWKPIYRDAFNAVIETWHPAQTWSDYKIKMSHFPGYITFSGDDKYSPWMPSLDDCDWLLCGHVHNSWQVIPEQHSINVGVDVHNYFPVSQDTLREIMHCYG
jgi:calcineurin-like phosphoesterase family protein